MCMWHLRAWFSGGFGGGAVGMTGPDGLRGLFQPLQFHGSMIVNILALIPLQGMWDAQI